MGCYKDIKKMVWNAVLVKKLSVDHQFGNASYYITISISNISNENVTRVLEERAKHVGALLFAVTVTYPGPKLVI